MQTREMRDLYSKNVCNSFDLNLYYFTFLISFSAFLHFYISPKNYSVRKLFTGFAKAALEDCQPTVITAIIPVTKIATANTPIPI